MSTKTIASLVVTLGANSAQLVTELAKSKRGVKKWSTDIRAQSNTVAKALTATTIAAGAAIVAIVNGQAAEIDRLAKKASSLSIGTSKLQKIRYQGELSGIDPAAMDKSLSKMLKTVSDANAGLSTAKRAFDELNLSAAGLQKMSTDQQFYAIAQAMNGIENQSDKTRIAMDIFGRSGADLINTLTSDLKATGAEFDSLGVAITSQQAAMVEAYNDSKSKLGTLWDGFLNQMTVQAAPAFKMIIDYVSQSVIEFGGMGKVASSVVNGIATGAGFVADVFYGWQLIIKGVQIAFGYLAKGALTALGVVYDKYASLREFMDSDFKRSNFFDGMADSFEFQTKKVQTELDKLLSKGRPSLLIDAKIKKIQADVAKAGNTVTEKNTSSQKDNTAATKSLTSALDKSKKAPASTDAWKKIFGPDKKDDSKNLKMSHIFSDYAKALNAAINRQDTNSMAYFVEQTQRTIDGLAGRGPNGLNFGSDRSYDIDGMQGVLDRLVDKMNETPEKIGSIDINVSADGKTVGGKLMGDPAFLKQLKQFVDSTTQETARAVAR